MVSYYKTKLRFFIMFSKPKETKNDDDDDDDDDDDIEQPDKSMAQTCQTNPSYNPIDAVWYNYPQNEAIFCKIHSTNIKYATAQKKRTPLMALCLMRLRIKDHQQHTEDYVATTMH
eukprot:1157267_1